MGLKSQYYSEFPYDEHMDTIELIEIYHKADKENENRERMLRHYT